MANYSNSRKKAYETARTFVPRRSKAFGYEQTSASALTSVVLSNALIDRYVEQSNESTVEPADQAISGTVEVTTDLTNGALSPSDFVQQIQISSALASMPDAGLSAPSAPSASSAPGASTSAVAPVQVSDIVNSTAVSTTVFGGSSYLTIAVLGLLATAGGNGSGSSSGVGQTYLDTSPPTVMVEVDTQGVASGPVLFTIRFDEFVTGFSVGKLSLTGGSLSGFVEIQQGKTFTVLATPDANSNGTLQLTVGTVGVEDFAGNAAVSPTVFEKDYAQSILQGTIVAGPVISTHNLTVKVFNAAGEAIANAIIDANGNYKVGLGSYSGTLVALVVDGDNSKPDYVDEVSKLPVDLSGNLIAVGNLSGMNDELRLNINPITSVAAMIAGVQVSADGVGLQIGSMLNTFIIDAANRGVAMALLGSGATATDLLSGTIVPTVNADGSDNLSANPYGKMLAVLSAMEIANASDTQTTLSTLKDGISTEGILATSVRNALIAGANLIQINLGDLPALSQQAATGNVELTGRAQLGGMLTVNTSGINDPDGTQLFFTYQWQVSDSTNGAFTDITHANDSTYSIAADRGGLGKFLRVVVTATNDGTANGTSFTSNPSFAVVDATPPDDVDLSISPGVQSSVDIPFSSVEARSGKSILPEVQKPLADDLGEIRIVLIGNWQTQHGVDQLVLDTVRPLDSDFDAQNVSLGGAKWAYQYTAGSRTLVLRQQSGAAISADQLQDALEAVQFKSSSASTVPRSLSLAYVDTAGNVGNAASVNLLVNTRPTVILRSDTGYDGLDRYTNDQVVLVTDLLEGATWQYRTPDSLIWRVGGTDMTFSLQESSYKSGDIQVRQRDRFGVLSPVSELSAFIIDVTKPEAPSISTGDPGSSPGYSRTGFVQLMTLIENSATWEYSVNGGASWQAGSSTGWTLAPGQYLAGTVQVRQTDRAGNTSTSGRNGINWQVDDAPPQVSSLTVNGGNALLLKPGQTSTVRLVFNEPVAQLSADDIAVTGATVTGWSSSDGGTTWTGVLSPAAMTLVAGVRLTLQGAYVDLSGRSGPTGAQSLAFDVDTVALDASRGFAITGARVGDYSGASVGWAGNAWAADANDAKQGVLIGSPNWRSSDEAEWAEGAVHGVLGRTATSDLDLSALAPMDGRAWTVGEAEAALGWKTLRVGDVNGDGRQDLALAAPYADAGVGADAGQVWVLLQSGASLADVAAGTGGWAMQGLAEGDALGWSVAAAGDVDGDGYDDVLMAAPYADASADALDAGQVMLVRGRADGTAGASTVWSSPNAGDWLGFAVAGGGDINGDGLADVLLAAPDADVVVGSDTLTDAGQVYVVYGSRTGMASLADVRSGTGGRLINGFAEGQSVGHAVAVVGDVNGDGYADMVVGASDHASARGGAWLVWGGTDDTPLDLGNPGHRAVYLFNGKDDVAQLGYAVAAAGDFNADGFADLVLAAPGTDGPAGAQSGAAYVVFGKATARWGASLDVTQLRLGDGSGLVYHGQAAGDGAAGMALAGGGDVNGDGLSDLLVGFSAAAGTRGVTQVLLGAPTYFSSISILGTSGDDALGMSESGAEIILAGDGNDTLYGMGSDVLLGGAGNDHFMVDSNWTLSLNKPGDSGLWAGLDGGAGVDTVSLVGSDFRWDLTSIPDIQGRLKGLEVLDMSGINTDTESQTVRIGVREVLAIGAVNVFNSANGWDGLGNMVQKHQILVQGTSLDTVELGDSENWQLYADIVFQEQAMHVFHHATSAAQLLVSAGVHVVM